MGEQPAAIRAVYPLYPPIRLHSEGNVRLYSEFVQNFAEPKLILVQGSTFHDGEVLTVRVRRCTPSLQKKLFVRSKFGLRTQHFLEFSGTFDFPGTSQYFAEDSSGQTLPMPEATLRSYWLEDLPERLDPTIQTYLCASLIAYSGAVYPTGNIWFHGNREQQFSRSYVSHVHESIEFLRRSGFQSLDALDFDSAIKWVFRQQGMFHGYSNTPAAKALSYFSRLFTPRFREDELSNTVWALAGIEALLVEGGRSSGGQLREKLSAIFGSSIEASWLVRETAKLYEFRSKMVHGNRHLKSAFRSHEDEESETRQDEETESELLAIGLLTVLLRRLIEANETAFIFKTVCVKPKQA